MSIRPLSIATHRVLRTNAAPVERFDAALRELVRDMIETMHAHRGIGLAAPQIGCLLQLFVVNPSSKPGAERVVINPVIERASGQAAILEGCLSLPEVWQRVARSAALRVRGVNEHGKRLVIQAKGLLAIALQHEIDHLQGRLIIDHPPADAELPTPALAS